MWKYNLLECESSSKNIVEDTENSKWITCTELEEYNLYPAKNLQNRNIFEYKWTIRFVLNYFLLMRKTNNCAIKKLEENKYHCSTCPDKPRMHFGNCFIKYQIQNNIFNKFFSLYVKIYKILKYKCYMR